MMGDRKPRPSGALLLTIYRDDLRVKLGSTQTLDPLVKAAALEMAGILALHEGRCVAAKRHFDRADDELARSGRTRVSAA